ncbi:hypothetical protein [Cohnella thailandensis]|uniref:Type II secretion system protein GspF domain-containing protein n=1 Tax=Cohnella thailandensis TaxID=557557 RepID=A0A841T262_9BACL|nr:hypothetical protein [Cohnella thailandensis]MBB6638473.1 hypothetical protein [Cohnella thailandensis]MBP1977467.1 hypothetical protein [Cohnella thailandensis]
MASYDQGMFGLIGWIVQLAIGAVGFAIVLRLLFERRPRWRTARRGIHADNVPKWWLRLTGSLTESSALSERRTLLAGCGIRIEPELYLASRRSLLAFLPALALLAQWQGGKAIPAVYGWYALFAACALWALALFDRAALESYKQYRTDRIRKELVVVSSQLLYYEGSKLHLHGKLLRCLPYTRVLRSEMQLLLNEWYHDADLALNRFKTRIGTGEAYGFAETLRALRMNEGEAVYEMLRETLREYKAKIELSKAGRKETASYFLFVLAGIPILYSFQIFIYPWVQESQKLFDKLGS